MAAGIFLHLFLVASGPERAAGNNRRHTLADALSALSAIRQDTAASANGRRADSLAASRPQRPSQIPLAGLTLPGDTVAAASVSDSLPGGLLPIDNFLDDVISGKNTDSLVYDVKSRRVFIYNQGDVQYTEMNLKADYIQIDMDTKEMFAYGVPDTLGKASRPEFVERGTTYTMDTIAYNIDSKKAKIKGVVTQEGEGFLIGKNVKKMADNVIHIRDGRYTTCDDHEHPHFYIALTRGKVIPGKKVISGYAYLVIEDVPIFFPGVPEAFFPLTSGRSSGFILPSFGEETARGFFLRDGGYYFAINDNADLTLRASIFTKGSWEARASSTYLKRYKYNGNLSFNYTKTILGDKGLSDYQNTNAYNLAWSHSQNPKANPGTTFSASVNFQTSGYAKYSSQTIQERQSATTQSSISYAKNWSGSPFSLSANMNLNQSRRDSTYTIAFPTVTLNMTRINPLKRKNAIGKERFYEKITLSYTGNLNNRVTVKERDFMQQQMFEDMVNGVRHSVPVSLSFNMLNYINASLNVPYNENWYFKKVEKEWDPVSQRQVELDPEYGFFRAYDYNFSGSLSTKLYGMYEVTDLYPNFPIRRIRHTLTPTVKFTYAPDFRSSRFGFWKPIQQDSSGTIGYYSPLIGSNAVPGAGRQGSLTFELAQTLEMKVKDDSDTTGMRKVKVIDNFSFNGSYNFLADSMNLSNISASLRITLPFFKNYQLNLTGTFSPYQVENRNGRGVPIDKYLWQKGGFLRLVSTQWSFSYNFNGGKQAAPGAINDTGSYGAGFDHVNPFLFDPSSPLDPELRRQLMTRSYYDFNVPWSLSFNYSVQYTNDGVNREFVQNIGLSGSLTLTQKWGISASGFGYDFKNQKFVPGVFNITRDLHCWQMNFSWTPFGVSQQWSFNISVKSSMLRDLKYDKRRSQFDNIYNQGS